MGRLRLATGVGETEAMASGQLMRSMTEAQLPVTGDWAAEPARMATWP